MRPIACISLPAAALLAATLGTPPAAEDPDRRRHEDLDARQQWALRRLADKEAAVAAVVRGELTFDQAADRLRASDAGDATAPARLRISFPRAGAADLYRWQLASFLRGPNRPPRAAALADRLEAGLRSPERAAARPER
jgi:hypothetical protein